MADQQRPAGLVRPRSGARGRRQPLWCARPATCAARRGPVVARGLRNQDRRQCWVAAASDGASLVVATARRTPNMSERVIGLALSGGGSRAAAFHLGCLRALHDRDLLRRVRVVSGISGGSLLAALWAYGPADFAEFDKAATLLLRRGLQLAIMRRAIRPSAVIRNLSAAASALTPGLPGRCRPVAARRANRTDGLASALADLAFGTATMPDVTHQGMDTVLTAADLRTGNAVRFGSALSSCSRFGTIIEPVPVATAVAASAAFPLLLPAIERSFTFERNGQARHESVMLSDGGIYDNLGLCSNPAGHRCSRRMC